MIDTVTQKEGAGSKMRMRATREEDPEQLLRTGLAMSAVPNSGRTKMKT